MEKERVEGGVGGGTSADGMEKELGGGGRGKESGGEEKGG